jgi:hypothetical protein
VRRALAVCGAAVALLAPALARGQSTASDAARADALFNAGKQLRDAGQWADACPNFAESKRLTPGVGISLYLADCYEHTGHTSSAYQEFREAERLARERNDKRAETAHARAVALESKLGGLLIAVPTAAGGEAPEILLDGTRVPPEQWNVAMTVEPGDHVVTVNARGLSPRTLKAHVDAGYRPTMLAVEESEPAPAPPSVDATAAPAAATTVAATGHTARVATGITLTALGVIGIGIGTWLAATAPTPPPSCTPPPQGNRATAEAIAYAAGAAALLGGVVVLTVTPPHGSTMGMTVSPMTMTSGAGAMFRTTF